MIYILIAIDGACKRNGKPDCSSAGAAWIQTDAGEMCYKSIFEETESTNQRGEINGLISALVFAAQSNTKEDIIIITDSEYLHNTVMLDWLGKWEANNWVGATGPVKNRDMWEKVFKLVKMINRDEERIFMQWTKGHLMSYSAGNIKQAMVYDPTGIELFMRITAVANRKSEKDRIVNDFFRQRREHGREEIPSDMALDWVIANTVADCLASYIVKVLDSEMQNAKERPL